MLHEVLYEIPFPRELQLSFGEFHIDQLLVFLSLVIDKLIKLIIKTDPKKIYPIGYIFFASNR